MAQQIQFISCTQAQYDAATKTSSKIYFISDTHRIYKGADLYAATDFDQITFSTLEASSLTVNGSAVALDGHTHTMAQVTGLDASLTTLSGSISTVSASVSAMNTALSGVTQNAITKSTGTFSSITVGGSSVALSGHKHSIDDIIELPTTLTGITSTDITKTGTISAAIVRGTTGSFTTVSGGTVKGGTGSFTTVSAGTVSAATGSFNTLKVGGVSVALAGHSHSAADLSGITFDEMTVDQFVASSITVDGKGVLLEGTVVGGVNYATAYNCGIQVSISSGTAVPAVTMWGFGPVISKSFVEIANSMTMDWFAYIPTVSAVVGYVEAMIGTVLSSQY